MVVVSVSYFAWSISNGFPPHSSQLGSSSISYAWSTNAQVSIFSIWFLIQLQIKILSVSNSVVSRNNFFSFRYFKHNENAMKVKAYINLCSRGDWFVLYQLSKNLNRPFFMDFLVTLAKTGDKTFYNFIWIFLII